MLKTYSIRFRFVATSGLGGGAEVNKQLSKPSLVSETIKITYSS